MKSKKFVFISPGSFEQIHEEGEQLPSSTVLPEQREMLIKGNYVLYFSDSGREFYFEKKMDKIEDIPAIKREAFEALVLFKASINGVEKSDLEPNI